MKVRWKRTLSERQNWVFQLDVCGLSDVEQIDNSLRILIVYRLCPYNYIRTFALWHVIGSFFPSILPELALIFRFNSPCLCCSSRTWKISPVKSKSNINALCETFALISARQKATAKYGVQLFTGLIYFHLLCQTAWTCWIYSLLLLGVDRRLNGGNVRS